ncbi:MAG: AI-2E family transporter [Bacteroidia bacterium]|nr:AI-2E family transporter [Bacteroidia bacterium]
MRNLANSNKTLPFYAKVTLVLVGLFTFITILYSLQDIIVPIIYSVIIATVLSPVVNFLVRKNMNRLLATGITVLSIVLVTLLLIALLSSQLIQFADAIPKLINVFKQLLNDSILWISQHFNISTTELRKMITTKNAELLSTSSSRIGATIATTGSVLVVLFLIPVYVFMILVYQPLLIEFTHKLFSIKKHQSLNKVLTATKHVIQSYLVGLLLEATIVAVLNSVSLLIIGIDYAILLGVIGAILNIIPYVGGIVAVALPMLIALATNSPSEAIIVFVVYMVIQLIDNNYIVPKVVASQVQINALVSIIVVIAGSALWGINGMFLSIPLTAIIKVICDNIDELTPWGYLLGEMPEPLASPIKVIKKIVLRK